MLLLSHFSPVWLCATPQTAAHEAPPSLGFSRQEDWSRLPFPSPIHESEVVKLLSRVWLLATPWTLAHQAHPAMGFSRQEYWSGVPLPSPAYCWVIVLKHDFFPLSFPIQFEVFTTCFNFPLSFKYHPGKMERVFYSNLFIIYLCKYYCLKKS